MKKTTSIILIISIFVAAVFAFNVYAEDDTLEIDGITYTSYDTYCELTKCVENKRGVVDIPSSVTFVNKDLPVTIIGEQAFSNCESITNITIPNSITQIRGFAFEGCNGLTSITIPDSVTYIGAGVFAWCSSLEEINLSHNISALKTDLPPYPSIFYISTFMFCRSLKKITVPDNVESLGDAVFEGCSSLEEVILPNGLKALTSITYYDDKYGYEYHGSFCDCVNLKTIYIPGSIEYIDTYTFNDCNNLETVYFGGSEEQWKNITINDNNEPLLNAEIIFNYFTVKPGDCNSDGETDNKDVVVLFRYVSGSEKAEDESVYDFNGDNEVNNKDVVALFREVSSK